MHNLRFIVHTFLHFKCFFRKMKKYEIDTPILLLIRDMNGHTFCGIASTKLYKVSFRPIIIMM